MTRRIVARGIGCFCLVVFTACASSTPRGKIVRLTESPDQVSVGDVSPQEVVRMHTQPENFPIAVPSAKDDAAVFYFSLGQAYSLDNETGKAIEAYRATLVHDPSSPLVHARLAAELVKIGNYTEARELAQKAIQLDPKYIDSYLLLAGIQVAAKEYDAALLVYREALKRDASNRDTLLYYGITLAESGKISEAIAQFEAITKLKDSAESNIDRAVAYFYMAKVYQQANRLSDALIALEKAMKARSGFAKAALLAADIYETQGKQGEARKILAAAFKDYPEAEIAERLAEYHLKRSQFKEAVVYLETMVEEDPTNENMRLKLALVYWQIKWYEKAHITLSGLYERYPASSEIAFYLGELAYEQKNFTNAVGYYSRVDKDYPKYEAAMSRSVGIYRDDKRYKEAQAVLEDALEKRPDVTSFYPLLAALYEDVEQYSDARDILEQGHKRFKDDENILYYLGFINDRLGNRDEAIATMELLVVQNPQNANALNFIGYTLLEDGKDMERAKAYLTRAYELKPKDPFILDSYAWLLHKTGNSAQAMKLLERAHGLRPDELVIAEHLADVYVALNLPRKALTLYGKVLGLGSEAVFKEKIQHKIKNVEYVLAKRVSSPQRTAKVPSKTRAPASVPVDSE